MFEPYIDKGMKINTINQTSLSQIHFFTTLVNGTTVAIRWFQISDVDKIY